MLCEGTSLSLCTKFFFFCWLHTLVNDSRTSTMYPLQCIWVVDIQRFNDLLHQIPLRGGREVKRQEKTRSYLFFLPSTTCTRGRGGYIRRTRYKEIFLFVTFCLFKGHNEFIGGVPEYRTTRETNIIAQTVSKKKEKKKGRGIDERG